MVDPLERALGLAHLPGECLRPAAVGHTARGVRLAAASGEQRLDLASPLLRVGECLVLAGASEVARGLVVAPGTGPLMHAMRPGIDLGDPLDRPVEERAIVRDEREPAVEAGEETLEPVQPVEVEVVRRLVEEEQVEPREQDRGQAGPSRLAAGEGRGLLFERDLEPELGTDRPGAVLEVAPTEREEALEREAVRTGIPRFGVPLDGLLRIGHPRAAGEVAEQRLSGSSVVLLRQVADRDRRWSPLDAALVRKLDPGEEPQQRRLAGAVSADDAEPRARPERQVDAIENGGGAVRLDDAGERDSHGRYLLRERGRAPAGGAEDVDVLVQSVMGGRRSAVGILQPVAEAFERRPARIARRRRRACAAPR